MKKSKKNNSSEGPLANHHDGFRQYLIRNDYSPLSANNLVGVFKNLNHWLKKNGKEVQDLNPYEAEKFLAYRKRKGYICWLSPKALKPMVNYLLESEELKAFELPRDESPQGLLIEAYREFLKIERQLEASTIYLYSKTAHEFLMEIAGSGLNFDQINAQAIRQFILKRHHSFSIGTVKHIVTSLRSFLRWLFICGKIDADFSKSVPAIAGWRLTGLPQGISERQIENLLDSCDRRTHEGRRAYAVLLLMCRLGLRKKEIASLSLDCVSWNRGELLVSGKLSQGRLPLQEEVGKSLASYIKKSRPQSKKRTIFLTMRAPYRPLSSGGISAILKYACQRASIDPIGAHKLRHTVAMRMLNKGSSLTEIGQVLRHSSIDTTAIYAKVDELSLTEVICHWPGGGR